MPKCTCGKPNCDRDVFVTQNLIVINSGHDSAAVQFNIHTAKHLLSQLEDAIAQLERQARSEGAPSVSIRKD